MHFTPCVDCDKSFKILKISFKNTLTYIRHFFRNENQHEKNPSDVIAKF